MMVMPSLRTPLALRSAKVSGRNLKVLLAMAHSTGGGGGVKEEWGGVGAVGWARLGPVRIRCGWRRLRNEKVFNHVNLRSVAPCIRKTWKSESPSEDEL